MNVPRWLFILLLALGALLITVPLQHAIAQSATAPVNTVPAPGADGAPPAHSDSLWTMLLSAGAILYPLSIASILVVTLILYCLLTLRESAIASPELLRRLEPFFEKEDVQGLAAFVAERPQKAARILDAVLKFLYRHPEADDTAIKAVAEAEGSRIASSMNQRVLYIMDIGVLSPMLGLLGTVIGILHSFSQIAADNMGSRANVLAGGVSQALVATGIGLVVGLTAMAAYAFFRGRVNHLISLLETHSTLLVHEIIAMKTRYRRRKGL